MVDFEVYHKRILKHLNLIISNKIYTKNTLNIFLQNKTKIRFLHTKNFITYVLRKGPNWNDTSRNNFWQKNGLPRNDTYSPIILQRSCEISLLLDLPQYLFCFNRSYHRIAIISISNHTNFWHYNRICDQHTLNFYLIGTIPTG